jgi:PAS domain-containing protein
MSTQGGKDTISTEQREAFQRSEVRFRILLEKMKQGVALFDREMNILYMSPALEHILGYTVTSPKDYPRLEAKFIRSYAQINEPKTAAI